MIADLSIRVSGQGNKICLSSKTDYKLSSGCASGVAFRLIDVFFRTNFFGCYDVLQKNTYEDQFCSSVALTLSSITFFIHLPD